MRAPPIIVVGASAGGVEALGTLAAALPENLSAALFVVLHIGPHRSDLPKVLNQLGSLPADHGKDGDPICPGRIYVAPPDHHMIIEPGFVRLTKAPRENWARPAIDPLFRSAAQVYGPNVVGVILTGGLNDGTAGLYEIKKRGGVTVVQNPDDAVSDGMPRSALASVTIDHCLPLAMIPQLLERLSNERAAGAHRQLQLSDKGREKEMEAEYTMHRPVAVTCPDCGGALQRDHLGALTQFRCHIGHVYTAEVMLAAQFVALERFIEAAMRSLNERAELCRQMAENTQPHDDGCNRASWEAAEHDALDQTAPLRRLLERKWIRPEMGIAAGAA